MTSNLKAGKITQMFVTRLYGDHFFGFPELFCTITLDMEKCYFIRYYESVILFGRQWTHHDESFRMISLGF
ncbi:putative Zinc phosphodiesterase ELAC protein [Naja naja]|nr:putative Zinc phosphodiesterase ELAC protein [Naja naja]